MADINTTNGRIFQISTTGADIVGFDPAKDKLDLGDVTVHNCIVIDTPQGVGFLNPWSGESVIVIGVSLAQLTIDSFMPVINDHLRQDLSGALAWEHGITAEAHTVYARSHEVGQIDRVAFDPATDVVDFRYFGTREQVYMTNSPDGVIISNSGTGHALILLGVTTSQLTAENFEFHFAQAREDRVALQLGFSSVPDSQILPQGVPIAGTNAWPTASGGGAPPSGQVGTTTVIDWHYGSDTVILFDPAKDKLDFGWFKAHEFSVKEVNGSTVISIDGNHQTYTLSGVSLYALDLNNIVALDTTARTEWQGLINNAVAPAALPTLSVSDGTVVEGHSGTTQMMFTVALSQASASPVSVSYSTLNGTATAGQDYTSTVGTLTFAAGETSKMIHVNVAGDTMVELNEQFSLHLSAASGATIMDGSAVGTIVNDDVDAAPGALPAISIGDLSVAEGNGEHMHFMFTVTLDKASTGPVTVAYTTANGTAVAGSDYVAGAGTVTFASGVTSQMVHVDILGDTNVEANETFTVTLSSPAGATIADGSATGTILNDDVAVVLPKLSIADATVTEGNSGTADLTFTVTLDKAATGPVSVQYGTANGTATSGSDYTARAGTLTFAAGETSKVVTVAVAGDTAVEANETLLVNLTNASGATIARAAATGTITNDDVASVPTGGRAVDYAVTSNWGSGFTASMSVEAGANALNGWTVEFDATFNITNIWNAQIVSHVGNHYVIRNQSYNGAVGANKETAFGFQASPGSEGTTATGFTLNGAATGGGTPVPVPPAVSIGDVAMAEGSSGAANLTFTVTLDKAATGPVSVGYSTANGTATAGSDYTAATGTVTFAAGETSKTIQVAVKGDTAVEANETFTVNLANVSGATIAKAAATGTITNDDTAPLPTLSVADIAFAEGGAGSHGHGAFTVTLSAASATAVTVNYATANGIALAGSDYDAASGTLTFAPGETTKVVEIHVTGDAAVEANETFSLVLSGASGATLARGTATGTIQNDDTSGPQPALPTVSIADVSVSEGNPGSGGAASGWLSTQGNQIVDAAGNTVQIAGVNWFGFEGDNSSPNGLWTRGYKDMMQQMEDLGFNTIRLPFSSDMLHSTAIAKGIDYSKNPDLVGLTPLQVMDKIVDYADQIGLKIILDHHRSDAGAGTSPNGLWYDSSHSEASWIADWQMLAQRYADDTAVIGADLHNEPYNGTWGGGGANDWAAAAERAGDAIGDVNTNWLIFVEGVGSYDGDNYWWGGNLEGVRDRPIELDVANKLIYSAHDYPNSVYNQPWFQSSDFAAHLPEKFDEMWGYIYKEGIAPVYIGEFGTKLVDPKDAPWLEAITSYMAGDFDNNGTIDIPAGDQGMSWTYWSWNPNSGDTGGILKDDWQSVNTNKLAYLEQIQFNFDTDVPGGTGAGEGDHAYASFVVTLSAPATEAVIVGYHTMAGEADTSDFTAVTGTLTFAAGEQSKTIQVPITADTLHEANEHFAVMLTDAHGAVIGVGTATGTIVNDDNAGIPTTPGTGTGGGHTGSGDLEALLAVVDSWNSGFNASVSIHNEGAATSGWQLEIDMPYQITSIWNAEIVSHDADGYVIRNAAWNGAIGADAEISFGFTGAGQINLSQVDIHI